MTRLTVGFIVLCIICALAIMWTMSAIHNTCEVVQAILDIMHSRDKIENLACRRIVELQADKGRLTDELTDKSGSIYQLTEQLAEQEEQLVKAKEIIREYMRFEPMVGTCSFYSEEYEKTKKRAEAFLKE